MAGQIKVSVILTSYNHAKYLRESIDSVLNQTYSDFELNIWDDASSDESWQIINTCSDPRIRAFRNEINRQVDYLNEAILDVAMGEYIAIHHSDDIWEPEKLEKQVAFLDAHPKVGAVFTWAQIIDENGFPFQDQSHFYYKIFEQPNRTRHEWLNHFFYNGNALCHPSVLIRRQCYKDAGLYRYGMAQIPDFDMWVRLCLKYEIHVLPEKLVRFRIREGEVNSSGDRPEVYIRNQFEFLQVYSNYLKITDRDEFLRIFPHTSGFFDREDFDIRFALAMTALSAPYNFGKLFGLQLLFDAMNEPERAQKIESLYGFRHQDLIQLTAKHDIFSVTILPELERQLSEQNAQVQILAHQLSEQNAQVQTLSGQLSKRDAQVQALEGQLQALEGQLQALEGQLQALEGQLHEINISKAWKVVMLLRRIRVFLIPPGSWREQMANLLLSAVRDLRIGGAGAVLAQGTRKIKQLLTQRKKSAVALSLSGRDTTSKTEIYVPPSQENVDPQNILAKIIAFYLPQFHPIPENDDWWGKGFTEWTNVAKAVPNFAGHYQPHQPDELGFYDLRILEVQERQVELAKKYGIYGFCFYYYWFAGKRLLERPLDQYLSHPHLDLPFCLCWANENWTRRWDGAEHDVLIAQEYTEEQYLHFIRDISINFLDQRYIRVDGRPILLVYRINLLPNPQKAAEVWRFECRKMGIGEIYLVAVQSFGITDPRPYGFDAAVEFPPSYLSQAEISRKSVKITNPRFTGKIFDYNTAARVMLEKKHGDYTLFKTVMPSWDNTARRQNESHIFINATPSEYQSWLENVVSYTRKNLPERKRFVFVNAWNEWAEGTHLEPDRRYGYAYLQATANAIQGIANKKFPFPPGWKLLFISHDAHKGGAQAALLSTLEWFKEHTSLSIKVLCLEGGGLLSRFEALADTIVLNKLGGSLEGNKDELTERLLDFCGGKPDLIYGNTVVAGKAYQWLHTQGVPILTHVYELEMSIQRYAAEWMGDVLKYSTQYITPSQAVKDNLVKNHAVDSSKIAVVYGAVSNEPLHRYESDKEKIRERKKLGLDRGKILVVGCGLGMPFRKGADLFIKLGDILLRRGRTDFHFYWVGGFEDSESDLLHGAWADHRAKLAKKHLGDFVTFLGYKENFKDYFQAADIFLLPSREDPLPLVAIEAAKCGLPLVCFADAGGTPDLVGDDAGFVVPFEDIETMAEKILKLMDDPDLRTAMGKRAREKFLSQFTVERTIPNILSTCRKVAGKKPAVSVIVPNYNHAQYLPERLESIFNQTFQDFEVLLLDDASTDNSIEILRQYAVYGDVRVLKNDQNSGSPFRQWLVGLDMARADILWIAESDDLCKPEFLENLLLAFRDPAVKIAYANSEVIDERGRVVGDYSSDTAEYLTSLSSTKWKSSYITNANLEINDALGIKNTILNVSAVLLRKFDMSLDFRETLGKMRIAGDWYFYVQAIKDGKVYYDFRKWNSHRRHSNSVIAQTVSDNKIRDFFREFSIVHKYIFNSYQLDAGFRGKWEQYLLQQLREFSLGSSYDVLKQYYPLDEMRALISNEQSSHSIQVVS